MAPRDDVGSNRRLSLIQPRNPNGATGLYPAGNCSRLGPARSKTVARDVCDGGCALRLVMPIASFDRFERQHRGDLRGESPRLVAAILVYYSFITS